MRTFLRFCGIGLLLANLAVLPGCDFGPGTPGGTIYGINAYLNFLAGKGFALCWTTPVSVPWISRVVYHLDPDDVEFMGFVPEAPLYFTLENNIGSFKFASRYASTSQVYIDFNSNQSQDSDEPVVFYQSSSSRLNFLYSAPYGTSSIYPQGTYTAILPRETLAWKSLSTEVTMDLMTPAETMTLKQFWNPNGSILPQVAAGVAGDLEIETKLDINNPNNVPIQVAIEFYQPSGSPWSVRTDSVDSSTHSFTVPPRSNIQPVFTYNGTAMGGWACFHSNYRADVSTLFTTYRNENGTQGLPLRRTIDAEAGLAGVSPAHEFVMGFERNRPLGLDTSFALGNPTNSPNTISATYRREGSSTEITKQIDVPAKGQTAVFFTGLFPEVTDDEVDGTVRFWSPCQFGAINLRTVAGKQSSSLIGATFKF